MSKVLSKKIYFFDGKRSVSKFVDRQRKKAAKKVFEIVGYRVVIQTDSLVLDFTLAYKSFTYTEKQNQTRHSTFVLAPLKIH